MAEAAPPPAATELALEEMRRASQAYSQAADQLDQKFSTLFAGASLVVGLFAVLQLTLIQPGQVWLYQVGVVALVLAYATMIGVALLGFNPKVYRTVVKADWEILNQGFFTATDQAAMLTLISSYVEEIGVSREINRRKATQVRWATGLLAAIISLLLVLSLLPR